MDEKTLKTIFTVIAAVAIGVFCFNVGNFLIAMVAVTTSFVMVIVIGVVKYGVPIALIAFLIYYLCKGSKGKKK